MNTLYHGTHMFSDQGYIYLKNALYLMRPIFSEITIHVMGVSQFKLHCCYTSTDWINMMFAKWLLRTWIPTQLKENEQLFNKLIDMLSTVCILDFAEQVFKHMRKQSTSVMKVQGMNITRASTFSVIVPTKPAQTHSGWEIEPNLKDVY